MLFAYTTKGWGLPIVGNPRNHSSLLTPEQVGTLRSSLGISPTDEWERPDPASPAGRLPARRQELRLPARGPR